MIARVPHSARWSPRVDGGGAAAVFAAVGGGAVAVAADGGAAAAAAEEDEEAKENYAFVDGPSRTTSAVFDCP